MTVELRVLESGQWDEWFSALERAFGSAREPVEEREFDRGVTELSRSIAAWDGTEVVGTAGAFSFRMAVPGGAVVPTAGVTMVSVASTHRRRGLLTSMMRRQLDEVHAGGEPLVVLTASEPAIYGRYGYEVATRQMSLEVDTLRAGLRAPAGADEVTLRFADPEESLGPCEEVYARLVPTRPGMLERRPNWERKGVLDPEAYRDGASNLLCVVAERDGEVRGYARYAVKPSWNAAGPDGTVVLRDLEALDPDTTAALWRYLFGIDLTSRVTSRNRPADDPVLHLVDDVRRCGVRFRDGLLLRPVEVGAALSARCYAAPVDVVLEVTAPFCPWNEGRWRLGGDAKGSSCERTTDPADLALSVRELGAAYLGDVSLTALARAGRVRELRQGALREAAVAFGGDVAPWLPHGF
ncbi:GNAT family N-acetyltransferase [Actinacidiphila sp. bgisy167]|uniref:GNAT family N-acetyltransferase n=1 Tax=Actinacidiphila sp. bgisy167 TaxID=3413797 RepID=UPI003D7082C2